MIRTYWRVFLLIAVILFLALIRFVDMGSAPFQGDEVALQLTLDRYAAEGKFPSLGLPGSQGFQYGPTALWFYAPVRAFTSSVTALMTWHALAMVFGILFLFVSIFRFHGRESALWFLFFCLCSPYLFHFSRKAWDNTLAVFLTGAVVYLVAAYYARPQQRFIKAYLVGAMSGLLFSLHLMNLPTLVAVAMLWVWYLIESREFRKELISLALALVGFVSISGSYFLYFLNHYKGDGRIGITSAGLVQSLPEAFFQTTRYFSAREFGYFLDGSLVPIREIMGIVFGTLVEVDFSWAIRSAGWVFLVILAFRILRGSEESPVVRLGILLFCNFLGFCFFVRPDLTHPHYMMTVWWVMFFFGAVAIQASTGWIKKGLQVSAVLMLLTNVAFNWGVSRFIRKHEGTRGDRHGSTLREKTRVVEEACRRTGANQRFYLSYEYTPAIFKEPFQYLADHLDKCKTKRIQFFNPRDFAEMPDPKWVLVYVQDPKHRSSRLILGDEKAARGSLPENRQ